MKYWMYAQSMKVRLHFTVESIITGYQSLQMTSTGYKSDYDVTKVPPDIALTYLMGELRELLSEYFREKNDRYYQVFDCA